MTTPDFALRLVPDVPIPPEQCFEGWTVPERRMAWFCPRPWRVVACVVDPRPGGAFATTMRSPEGVIVENEARFGFVCELRFDPLPNGGTRYQATVHHVDAAGRDAQSAMGFEAGWNAALDQLVALMQARRAGEPG